MNLTRRNLFKLLAASSASIVISSGLQGCMLEDDKTPLNTGTFDHGVASGDPQTDSVMLWTRATPAFEGALIVGWEVATDDKFTNLVNSGTSQVTSATDYTLKVDVKTLQAGTVYFYRFKTNGATSILGKTKTLATDPQQIKMAVLSCANFPAGFFHAYGHLAQQDNVDVVLHLGDYIYEYDINGYADAGDGRALNRVHNPINECITLADYRLRYAQYRSDEQLQQAHKNLPFICVWDDHEVSNDTYINGAENHSTDEGDFTIRRAAAIQAWYEWLPVRVPKIDAGMIEIYRRFDFGTLASLIMLDTRVIGRDKQLDYLDYYDALGAFDSAQFQADMSDSERSMLGFDQKNWLLAQMQDAKADGITWQILGQQVLMGRMYLPGSIIALGENGLPDPQNLLNYQTVGAAYQALATAVVTTLTIDGTLGTTASYIPNFETLSPSDQAIALTETLKVIDNSKFLTIFSTLSPEQQTALVTYGDLLDPAKNPKVPYNLDAWDGYAVEREQILGTARALSTNLVVLAGDTHNAWANNLVTQDGTSAGVEFATSSVSSPGLEKYLQIPEGAESATEGGILQLIDTLKYFDSARRGYLTVLFTEASATAQWWQMPRLAEKLAQTPVIENTKTLVVIKDTHQLEPVT